MKEELEFYKSYHTNSINKLIHFICIPMIVLSIIVLINGFYIAYDKILDNKIKIVKYPLSNVIILFYILSYIMIGFDIGILMLLYFSILKYLSVIMIYNNYTCYAKYIFILGWVFQFIGHYIEGKRPALFDSITQAFYQAPLFSLEYIFPSIFDNL